MDDDGNLASHVGATRPPFGAAAPAVGASVGTDWLSALPVPAAVIDRHERVQRANRRFCERFMPAGQIMRCVTVLSAFEGLEPEDGLQTSAGATGFHGPSGHWYHLHRGTLADGESLLTLQDLTERAAALRGFRELQEQLLFSSRVMSLGEMTTTLAHELNQPLATILNYLSASRSLLEQAGPDLSDQARSLLLAGLGQAQLQTEHAAAVVARIREFVRAREPALQPESLAEAIGRVLQLQRLDAHQHQVRIHAEIDPALPMARMDRVMVEQVLANLLRNAIEAMESTPPPEREIRLRAGSNLEGRLEVRISDRGCGLGQQPQDELFTPFFTTKPNGMGVGLALCRSIIEYHEGSLYAEPNSGRGLTFVFTLPVAEA